MSENKTEVCRKADAIQATESKLPKPDQQLDTKPIAGFVFGKRAPKLGQIGRSNSTIKNGKTIFASQNVSLDIPRKGFNV